MVGIRSGRGCWGEELLNEGVEGKDEERRELESGSGGGWRGRWGFLFYRSSTTNWTTPTTNHRHQPNARSGTTNSLAFLHRFASHLDR